VEDERMAERLPLRILVAEDNSVNQQLITLMLKKIGYRPDVVANGMEVLEAVRRRPYDAILMDIQMPEMDGLEATRRIHSMFDHDRPYIIAATANALEEERRMCLAAGMDDYLSKPIRMEDLVAALNRRPSDSLVGGRPPVIDRAPLDQLIDNLGPDAAADLISVYLTDAPALLRTLGRALAQEDADGFRLAAHTLKSSSAPFGANALSDMCRRLEALGRANDLKGASGILVSAEAAFDEARVALEARVKELIDA
jgi:CheY-like chemotaxis protein